MLSKITSTDVVAELPALSYAVAVMVTGPSGNTAVGMGSMEPYGATESFQKPLPTKNSTRSIWPLSLTSAMTSSAP